jgi:hypothetical protein
MAEVNETKTLVDYLLSIAALTTLVYGDTDVPPSTYVPNAGPCVCLKVRGGAEDDESDAVKECSFQFKIYAVDGPTARAEARKLHAALQNARTHTIKNARRETQPVTLEEPENGWIFVLMFYSVLFTNVS